MSILPFNRSVLAWFIILILGTPAVFLLTYFTVHNLPQPIVQPRILGISAQPNNYDQLHFIVGTIGSSVQTGDGRSLILANYLHRYNSQLESLSEYIVSISDKYHLDYRLLVAIAQQESNLCKRIPLDSYNCWGFGIYGDKVTRFTSYEEGIETVAKVLKRDYLDKGLDTPEKIMAKYTPPSVEKGGPWAKGVNQFLSELE